MPARASERELREIDDCLRQVQHGTEVATWLFAIAILVTACVWPHSAHAAEAARPAIPIRFTLDKPGVVTLVVDDAQGNRVRNLIAETPFAAGEHVVRAQAREPGERHPQIRSRQSGKVSAARGLHLRAGG